MIAPSARNAHNRKVVRWYLMVYPYGRKGLTDGLEREIARRKCDGERQFEYFAPKYVETKEIDGKLVTTEVALLYNYFFVHASEDEVIRLKKFEPQYNFLHRVTAKDGSTYLPYVKDEIIQTLQWIARSYAGVIPLYLLDQTLLIKGDRIRITKGQFKGVTARVVTRPKSPEKEVMVFVENWLCVPLINVKPGQYKVIDLNESAEHANVPYGLDNQRLSQSLHEALCRYYRSEATEEDRKLAQDTLDRYSEVVADSTIQRCKLYSLLLPACRILEAKEKQDGLLNIIDVMMPSIKAEQSLARLLVLMYACTDNRFWYEQAHKLVDPWTREDSPKKSKQELIRRLADYDECLGH